MKIPAIIILLSSLLFGVYFVTKDPWKEYYQKTANRDPRPILTLAINKYLNANHKNQKALDIGAGAGNETNYLIEQGYEVWALDPTPASLDYIMARVPESRHHKLHLIQSKLEDLIWNQLP